MLTGYGLMVNLMSWDPSRLPGAYVAAFALAAVPAGRFGLGEDVPASTRVGLGPVVAGGLMIRSGRR